MYSIFDRAQPQGATQDSVAPAPSFQPLAAGPGTSGISGRVWHDANGNGLQDAGERGLAYQSLYVYGYADDSTYMIATDGWGDYRLDGLVAGDYYLQFQQRYNGVFTLQGVGGDPALDSDADATGRVDTFALAAGEQRDTVDVGMVLTDLHDASISGKAWFDVNANGLYDFGEEFNMPGVGVTLHDAGADGLFGTADDSTQRAVTNGTGWYEFYDLAAGRYQVVFDTPAGYRFTAQNVPTDYGGWDSDVDANGVAPVIELGMGEYVSTVADAGFMRPDGYSASVRGTAWVDFDGDGVQDPWVLGMGGMRVYLYSYVDGSTQTTLTDFDGHYTFFGLAPGEYYLLFEGKAGYAFTTTGAGDDDTLDSDADSAGYVAAFTLADGEQLQSADAGLIDIDTRSASVADRAWHDLNANGVQDAGEAGAADMRVYLYSYNDGSTAVTFTDDAGEYRFDDLAAGAYYLLFEGLDGYGFTAADQGGDATRDSDVRASGHSAAFDLGIGEQRTDIAAGLVALPGGAERLAPASLPDAGGGPPSAALNRVDGRVWIDANANGGRDTDEDGAAGVLVTLAGAGPDGVFGTADDTAVTTATRAGGLYDFEQLPDGHYRLEFGGQAGYRFTPQGFGGPDAANSDVDAGGMSPGFTVAGGMSAGFDAGLVRSGTASAAVGDRVWNDANGNGVQDSGEAGLAGMDVLLYSYSDGVTRATVTDAQGHYGFNGLSAGEYYLLFGSAGSYRFTTPGAGADAQQDSDANAAGYSAAFWLGEGAQNLGVDAGVVANACASIVGAAAITEGGFASYAVQLSAAVPVDTVFQVTVQDGTARFTAAPNAPAQTIAAGGGYKDAGTGVLHANQYWTPNGVQTATGPSDMGWDFGIARNGSMAGTRDISVTVKAGQTTSNTFDVYAWRETVFVDKSWIGSGYDTHSYREASIEKFALKLSTTSADVAVCDPSLSVQIQDASVYHLYAPTVPDLAGRSLSALGQLLAADNAWLDNALGGAPEPTGVAAPGSDTDSGAETLRAIAAAMQRADDLLLATA